MPDDYFSEVLEDAYHRPREEAEQERRECVPDPKPLPRVKRRSSLGPIELRAFWNTAILDRDQGCCLHANPADCGGGWQAHHVVKQQELRRSRPDLLWHPLSGMALCGNAHVWHHNRVRPILPAEIPEPVLAFLRAAGYSTYLERHYP